MSRDPSTAGDPRSAGSGRSEDDRTRQGDRRRGTKRAPPAAPPASSRRSPPARASRRPAADARTEQHRRAPRSNAAAPDTGSSVHARRPEVARPAAAPEPPVRQRPVPRAWGWVPARSTATRPRGLGVTPTARDWRASHSIHSTPHAANAAPPKRHAQPRGPATRNRIGSPPSGYAQSDAAERQHRHHPTGCARSGEPDATVRSTDWSPRSAVATWSSRSAIGAPVLVPTCHARARSRSTDRPMVGTARGARPPRRHRSPAPGRRPRHRSVLGGQGEGFGRDPTDPHLVGDHRAASRQPRPQDRVLSPRTPTQTDQPQRGSGSDHRGQPHGRRRGVDQQSEHDDHGEAARGQREPAEDPASCVPGDVVGGVGSVDRVTGSGGGQATAQPRARRRPSPPRSSVQDPLEPRSAGSQPRPRAGAVEGRDRADPAGHGVAFEDVQER